MKNFFVFLLSLCCFFLISTNTFAQAGPSCSNAGKTCTPQAVTADCGTNIEPACATYRCINFKCTDGNPPTATPTPTLPAGVTPTATPTIPAGTVGITVTPQHPSSTDQITITVVNLPDNGAYVVSLINTANTTTNTNTRKCINATNNQVVVVFPPIAISTWNVDVRRNQDTSNRTCNPIGAPLAATTIAPQIVTTNTPVPTVFLTPPCGDYDVTTGRCKSVKTSLGLTIDTNPGGVIRTLFTFLLSIAGGIAIFMIIFSGYKLITSQGNPEAIAGAKETITSAIIGLLFIIFALTIFQLISVDILKFPTGFISR